MNESTRRLKIQDFQKQSTKTMLSRLNSTSLAEEIQIQDGECKNLRAAWHYLVTTESKLCVDITREFIKSHKKLVGTLANLTDETGRKAIHVALSEQREEIEKLLLLCGRYRINSGPVVHRSKTCEVIFAVDVKDTSKSTEGRPVAIKVMKDRNQWECEIRARQKFELDSCVVKLLGWHVPQGEETISGDALHPEPSDPRSKF